MKPEVRMPCAGNNTVAALLAGAIDSEAARRLEAHLDACPGCRELVAELGRGLMAVAGKSDRMPRPGDMIGRYEIVRVVGVGGMGVVYEARDSALARTVALKLLRPDLVDTMGVHLLAEAQAMARLQHPNVVAVHDVGRHDGHVFVAMELVDGETLRAWLKARRRTWREIVRVFTAAGEGLAYVHRAHLVHLDFKPDNVLVDRSGRVRVTDFGVARMVHQQAIGVVGTPGYMAPEQRRGERTDARTDQYSFCISLREALGDRAPRWLSRVIERGLADDPRERFASMDTLLAAIARGMRPRRTGVLVVAASLAIASLFVAQVSRPTKVVTREVPTTRIVAAAPSSTHAARRAAEPRALRPLDRMEPREIVRSVREPQLVYERSSVHVRSLPPQFFAPFRTVFVDRKVASSSEDAASTAGGATQRAPVGPCDDGSITTCAYLPPTCPKGTIAATFEGCWTCAAEESCAPLGVPHSCSDGSRRTCNGSPPSCGGYQVAAIVRGCWQCMDPFTCPKQVVKRPSRTVTRTEGSGSGCGSMGCGSGSDWGSNWGSGSGSGCGSDGCGGSGSGSWEPWLCGDGYCEPGYEDESSCSLDCNENTP